MPNPILKQATVVGAGIGGLAAAKAVADAVVHCQTPLSLRTQEMLRTSTLLAEPSALAPRGAWKSPPSTT